LGLQPQLVVDMALWVGVAALLGARLMYVALETPWYFRVPWRILYLREGGLSMHGGVAGGLLAAWLFARRRGVHFGKLADAAAPAVAWGTAVTRIGCHLEGCCYGRLTEAPWGVLTHYAPGLRHPTQLAESALCFLLFALLWHYGPRLKPRGGTFLAFAAGYSVIRFGVEFYREVPRILPWLSVAQAASVVIIVVAVLWYWRLAADGEST